MKRPHQRNNRYVYSARIGRNFGFALFSTVMAIFLHWALSQNDGTGERLVLWFSIILFGWMAAVFLLSLFPAFCRIELTKEGFYFAGIVRRKFYRWEEVTKFSEFRSTKGRWPFAFEQVEAHFAINHKASGLSSSRKDAGLLTILISSFRTPPNFVKLMNQFREMRIRQIAPKDPLVDLADIDMEIPYQDLNLMQIVLIFLMVDLLIVAYIIFSFHTS